jgi:hypothetical protein
MTNKETTGREAFELHATTRLLDLPKQPNGNYASVVTQEAWEAWQAASCRSNEKQGVDFDVFREVSLIHQKHADWEAITTLAADDPSYDTFSAGFKTAVGVIEQYITHPTTEKKEAGNE